MFEIFAEGPPGHVQLIEANGMRYQVQSPLFAVPTWTFRFDAISHDI
jgi:hypothetical protein